MLTTNLCVLGRGNPVLSPQDLASCDSADHGCNGGTLPGAWDYIDKNGFVSDDRMPYIKRVLLWLRALVPLLVHRLVLLRVTCSAHLH